MEIKINHMYIIKDSYYEDFPDPYLKGNKEEKRPQYFIFEGKNSEILWFVPLSSQIEKFERLICKKEAEGKPCDVVHICKIGSRKQAFVIQDMFPITKKYIKDEYKINNIPYKLVNKKDIKIIEKKANKILSLHEKGIKLMNTQPDTKAIERNLLQKINENELKKKAYLQRKSLHER